MSKMTLVEIIEVATLIIVIIALILLVTKAPCGMYKFTPNKDVPARCIGEYNE